jgi:hypothetical protein
VPGSVVIPNCGLPENTRFAQVLSGDVPIASDGSADTQLAGQLNNQHAYQATDDTDIVNVMEFDRDLTRPDDESREASPIMVTFRSR